jgi:hypothetical protein
MAYSQAGNYDELRAMVETIVVQVLGDKLGGGGASSWMVNSPRVTPWLSYPRNTEPKGPSGTDMFFEMMGDLGGLAKIAEKYYQGTKRPEASKTLGNIAGTLGGLAGMYGAYRSGDPISGAMSGLQLGTALHQFAPKAFGSAAGPIGAIVGFLAGALGGPKMIDEWKRPKFKDAKKAYEKLFMFDRGEEDEYYMPESYYFRAGGGGRRSIVVRIGNNQFDDHIRESLTSSYSTQLERGLVF